MPLPAAYATSIIVLPYSALYPSTRPLTRLLSQVSGELHKALPTPPAWASTRIANILLCDQTQGVPVPPCPNGPHPIHLRNWTIRPLWIGRKAEDVRPVQFCALGLRGIPQCLGHAKLETTQMYAESSTERMRESYQRA